MRGWKGRRKGRREKEKKISLYLGLAFRGIPSNARVHSWQCFGVSVIDPRSAVHQVSTLLLNYLGPSMLRLFRHHRPGTRAHLLQLWEGGKSFPAPVLRSKS